MKTSSRSVSPAGCRPRPLFTRVRHPWPEGLLRRGTIARISHTPTQTCKAATSARTASVTPAYGGSVFGGTVPLRPAPAIAGPFAAHALESGKWWI
jgi:hypothetical protein